MMAISGKSQAGTGIVFISDVIRKTTSEIRTFLDELSNGTSNYRSLHNLTEQVTHEYDNRFLIELIQNAHDVLHETLPEDGRARLAIIIEPDEAPHGALYVANDGLPFSSSNFISLSRFGQSDKNPEKSIGHKGIGFRSVLEITHSPEIYSRATEHSSDFDGYCFKFEPTVAKLFEPAISELLNGNHHVSSPLDRGRPLVDWSEAKLASFRSLHGMKGEPWLRLQLGYLSPYLLPLPLNDNQQTPRLKVLKEDGFSTVVRLPFKDDEAQELALAMLADLDADTALFLERVAELHLEGNGKRRTVHRSVRDLCDQHRGEEVTLIIRCNGEPATKNIFWRWEELIGGKDSSEEQEEIAEAVADLTGNWPEVRSAKISIAVRVNDSSEEGIFNIYLPTGLPTGCAAHINAPFFSHINRKSIDFNRPYNQLLLQRLARLAVKVIQYSLAGKELSQARAIIDMLAPSRIHAKAGMQWFALISKELNDQGIEMPKWPICLSDQGWDCLDRTSLLPTLSSPKIINEDLMRHHACFPAFVAGLSSRKEQIEAIFEAIHISAHPLDEGTVATIEKIAQMLHSQGDAADWNGYWTDLMGMFDKNPMVLQERKILLGNDGELHASSADSSVFFIPRQGLDDDDVLGETEVLNIPDSLRGIISFLSERVHVHEEHDARKNKPLRDFLASSLVQKFRVESILSKVLHPHIPTLPVRHSSQEGGICRDILLWGLRLVAGMADRGKGKRSIFTLLKELPAPCLGGWYPTREVSFGPGWINTIGEDLHKYFQGTGKPETIALRNRLLVSPRGKKWDRKGEQYRDLLIVAGVFDGIQPQPVSEGSWESEFTGYSSLPSQPPPEFSQTQWDGYRSEIEDISYRYPSYLYQVRALYAIPGLARYDSLDEIARMALMRVLFRSIPNWGEEWKRLRIEKMTGKPDIHIIESPLLYCLRTLSWLCINRATQTEWANPRQRWYIPKAYLAGKAWQFSHLNPLPGNLSESLDRNPKLRQALSELGMPQYDPENSTDSPRLLEDLARALDGDILDRNVFIGHVRMAWNLFRPLTLTAFPKHLIVTQGSNDLQVVEPTSDSPVYLPNTSANLANTLSLRGLPVIEIDTADAKELANDFTAHYGDAIQLASELTDWPFVCGERWVLESGELISSTDLNWIPPLLLSLFAYAGNQPYGPHTKRFSQAVQDLREARICWVDSLQVGLWRGEVEIARESAPAVWLADHKMLVCDNESLGQVSLLADALETLVRRGDLKYQLRFVLEKLEKLEVPSSNNIHQALSILDIKPEQFMFVNEQWRGDISQSVKMSMPIIALFRPDANLSELAEVNTDGALYAYLLNLGVPHLDEKDWRHLLLSCDDYYSLGNQLYGIYGEEAELSLWNQALLACAEKPLTNKLAEEQYRQHLEEASFLLNAALAHIARERPEIDVFPALAGGLNEVAFPVEFADRYWEVPFHQVMREVQNLFTNWLEAEDKVVQAIGSSRTIGELSDNLIALGIDVTFDPFETRRANWDCCTRMMQKFMRIAIAWCLHQKVSPLAWERNPDDLVSRALEGVASQSYLKLWNETYCFSLLKEIPRESHHKTFWEHVDASSAFHNLTGALALSEIDLDQADERLEAYKQKRRQHNRIISVCGKDFDNSEENLSALWNHILDGVAEDRLPELPLKNILPLKATRSRKRKSNGKPPKKSVPIRRGRLSKSLEMLIGLAGEIHVYRMLRKTYGEQVMNNSSWISSNSTRVFPDNKHDDGYGCDFTINVKNRKYFVEVKSTQSDNESFELGSSEVKLAMDLSKKSSRKRGKFIVLHVTHALSQSPCFRILPNPYEDKYQGFFTIDNAGVRLRYRQADISESDITVEVALAGQ